MPAIRAIAALVLAAAAVTASEPAPVDLKAQMKSTYAEVLKEGDLWSAIQLESFAAAQKEKIDLRGAPCLGGSDIYGDPLFACPDEVHIVADHGDSVAVLTSQRCHLYSSEGRPLGPSVAYGIRGDVVDYAFDGGFVGVVTWTSSEKQQVPQRWRARVVGASGNMLFESDDQENPETSIGYYARVANDGSAVAFSVYRHGADRHVIVVSSKGHKSIDGVYNVRGVGPMASWVVADEGGESQQLLIVGEKRVRLRSSAVGPGLVAGIMEDGKAIIVDRTGKGDVLTLPMAMGREPQVATVGRWLVVSSGGGARSLDNTNLLGEPMGEAPPQPNTMAVFRWDDLVGDIHAHALQTYENQIQISTSHQAATYLWHDKQVDLLDLSGKTPSVKTLARFSKEVDWVCGKRNCFEVVLRNASWVLVDAQGQEVAADPVEGEPTVLHRSWATVRHGKTSDRTYSLVKLAADPALRSSVQLKLPVDEWSFRMDPRRSRLYAESDRKWVEFDLNGEELGRGNLNNRPTVTYEQPTWPTEGGRFCWFNGRVALKSAYDDLPEAMRLTPRDGWQVNRTVIILARDERVLVSGKKKNEFIDLGPCSGAVSIALRRDEPVIANSQGRIIGTLAAGPSLALDLASKIDADAPAAGPWRIEGMQFSPPHAGTLEWDDRAGFVPIRLRSPRNNDPVGMILVTSSLVINLDPAAARLVGKKR